MPPQFAIDLWEPEDANARPVCHRHTRIDRGVTRRVFRHGDFGIPRIHGQNTRKYTEQFLSCEPPSPLLTCFPVSNDVAL
jgi:hypothetical protein